jgi:hypothetical protein
MSDRCPNGHLSSTSDYCDECGAPMAPAAPGQPTDVLPVPTEVVAPPPAPEPCPECGLARALGTRFCESCGYDFVTATSGAAAEESLPAARGQWYAIVTADRAYFERSSPDGLVFPDGIAPREVLVDHVELEIGRVPPAPDAAAPARLTPGCEDPAVSRLHAILRRLDDDSYAVVDLGSTNGTTLNEDGRPIPPNIEVPLSDGDAIHLGAWTTITFRRR